MGQLTAQTMEDGIFGRQQGGPCVLRQKLAESIAENNFHLVFKLGEMLAKHYYVPNVILPKEGFVYHVLLLS